MEKTINPIREWAVEFTGVFDNADEAKSVWHQMVVANEWSAVGDPEVGKTGFPGVERSVVSGRIVERAGLTIDSRVQDELHLLD